MSPLITYIGSVFNYKYGRLNFRNIEVGIIFLLAFWAFYFI
jgi:hypothetical protein